MTFPGREKRLYPRKNLRTRVIFEDETGEGFVYFYSTDVSLGGLFFESDVPLKPGTQVFLSFSLKDGEKPIRTTGQVARVERESGSGFTVLGVGIQFLDLADESKKKLEDYVTQ